MFVDDDEQEKSLEIILNFGWSRNISKINKAHLAKDYIFPTMANTM